MEVGLAPELRSATGLEDVLWHIAEWVEGRYQEYAGQKLHGSSDDYRTVRGNENAETRRGWPAHQQREDVGFRCIYPAGEGIPAFLR